MGLNAPFVMKLSYYLPSEDNQKKNVAHINYIIRAGAVDYGAMEPENKESVEIARQEMEHDELIHLQYMHERPRSSGLFGENGNLDINDTKKMLSNHEGLVWRCIVSLREDDAIRLDRIERSKWEDSLKASFAEIQDKLGMPASNFCWTAAYHPEPGHPHCHLLFWEENPVRNKGTLSPGEMIDIKKAFVKNICTRDREQLLMEKEYYRNAMRNGVRDLLGLKKNLDKDSASLQARLGGRPGIAPKLYPEQKQYLHSRLEHLSGIMPGHGRVAFDYMPEAVKKEVGDIADWVMAQPDFVNAKDLYLQANLDIVNMYMRDQPEEIKQAMDRAYNDLRKRIAQDVLKAAVKFPDRQEPPQPEFTHDPPHEDEEILFPAEVNVSYNDDRLTRNFCPVVDTPERPWMPDKEGNISMEWFRGSFRLVERELHAIAGGKRIELPNFRSWKSGVEQLKGIIPYIPDDFDGRAVMAYLPRELKAKVQETADWLLAREEMQKPLQKYLQNIEQQDVSKAYQIIRDRIAENALQSALQMQGKEIPKVNMILHKRRANEVTQRLISAKTDVVKGDENEAKWTAGKIHEALTKIGVLPAADINQVVTAWATNAELSEDIVKDILGKDYSGENELNFIGKGGWSRLRDNLGYREHELLTPWMGQMEKDPQKEVLPEQLQKPIPPPTFHADLKRVYFLLKDRF